MRSYWENSTCSSTLALSSYTAKLIPNAGAWSLYTIFRRQCFTVALGISTPLPCDYRDGDDCCPNQDSNQQALNPECSVLTTRSHHFLALHRLPMFLRDPRSATWYGHQWLNLTAKKHSNAPVTFPSLVLSAYVAGIKITGIGRTACGGGSWGEGRGGEGGVGVAHKDSLLM